MGLTMNKLSSFFLHGLVLLVLTACVDVQKPAEQKSLLIVDANVIDGTGGPARITSIRITGKRITDIGNLSARPGEESVDAQGLVLSPGFIDTHSHHDTNIFELPDALSAVSQGITTIVVGVDGGSASPLSDFFDKLQTSPVAINIASYSGHNTLRTKVML